jgi:hypothetical protein
MWKSDLLDWRTRCKLKSPLHFVGRRLKRQKRYSNFVCMKDNKLSLKNLSSIKYQSSCGKLCYIFYFKSMRHIKLICNIFISINIDQSLYIFRIFYLINNKIAKSNVIIIQKANTKLGVGQNIRSLGGVSILCWPVTPAVRPLSKLGIQDYPSSKAVLLKQQSNKGYETNHSAYGPVKICNRKQGQFVIKNKVITATVEFAKWWLERDSL